MDTAAPEIGTANATAKDEEETKTLEAVLKHRYCPFFYTLETLRERADVLRESTLDESFEFEPTDGPILLYILKDTAERPPEDVSACLRAYISWANSWSPDDLFESFLSHVFLDETVAQLEAFVNDHAGTVIEKGDRLKRWGLLFALMQSPQAEWARNREVGERVYARILRNLYSNSWSKGRVQCMELIMGQLEQAARYGPSSHA